MTATTTPREVRSPIDGRVPNLDSPGTSAPARATISATDSDRNRKTSGASNGSWLARQRFWTAQPASLEQAWNSSRVDPRRIPNGSVALHRIWKVSNATDRLVMLALIQIAPGCLQGPLRHYLQRPTRRWALYVVLTLLAAALIVGG